MDGQEMVQTDEYDLLIGEHMPRNAFINTTTNICENISIDDRPVDEIPIDPNFILIDLESTPVKRWKWDKDTSAWIIYETIGNGGIGFNWDGQYLIEPHP